MLLNLYGRTGIFSKVVERQLKTNAVGGNQRFMIISSGEYTDELGVNDCSLDESTLFLQSEISYRDTIVGLYHQWMNLHFTGSSTFLNFNLQDSIIATWGNRTLTRCILMWSILTLIFVMISYSGLSYLLRIYVGFHNNYWRHVRIGWLLARSWFCFRYTLWVGIELGDYAFKKSIQIFNIYNIKRALFLWSYYCLMTGGFQHFESLFVIFCIWWIISSCFNFIEFEDFYQYESRFLTPDESKDAKIKQAVLYGQLSQLDYLLPYSITSFYRKGYVYFVIKTTWQVKNIERKSYTVRRLFRRIPDIPSPDPVPDGPEPDGETSPHVVPGPSFNKRDQLTFDLKKFVDFHSDELRKFARTWVYTQYSKAVYQALCEPSPRKFYVGQGLYNSIMDQNGEHIDQLEDVIGLIAALVNASYHVNSTAKNIAIVQAMENFRKSSLGTKICNGISKTAFSIDDVFKQSELGEQISDFISQMSETVSSTSRRVKQVAGDMSLEKGLGLAAVAYKMISNLTASKSASAFRQKVEARRKRDEISTREEYKDDPDGKKAARAMTFSSLSNFDEPTPFQKALDEMSKYKRENMVAFDVQAGESTSIVDSFEAIRTAISMGKEGAQYITSGKVLKLIASIMALGTLMRTGTFEPRAYDELVGAIRQHPIVQSTCLFEGICEACNWLLSTGQEIYHGGNPFTIPTAIRKWEKESMELLLHQRFVGNDTLQDASGKTIDPMLLRIKLVDCIAQYNRISVQLSTLTSSKDSLKTYKSLYDQLRVFLAELRIKEDTGSTRIPPLGILLHGAPGIGKTTLINAIFSWLSLQDGLPFDRNAVFRRPPGSKFWSNFNSEKLWLILDDVATFRPASKKVDESLTDIIHVLNSSPFNPDMNQNDEKGKFACNVRAVCATTNKLDMDVHVDFNSPGAIFRRFQFYLTVRLKQGPFNVDGHLKAGNMTDADYDALGVHSCRLYPDFWEFDVHEYRHGGLVVTRTYTSFHDLMTAVGQRYVDHRKVEGAVKDRELEYGKVVACPATGIPDCACTCALCPKGKVMFARRVIATRLQAAAATRAAAVQKRYARIVALGADIERRRRDNAATKITSIARGFLARKGLIAPVTPVFRGLVFSGIIQSGTTFSFMSKPVVVVAKVWFTWTQVALFLISIYIMFLIVYIIYRLSSAVWRGLKADVLHVITTSMNAQLDTTVNQVVVDYYPQVCTEVSNLLQVELASTKAWFMLQCRQVLRDWTFERVSVAILNKLYLSSISLGLGLHAFYVSSRRSLALWDIYRTIKSHMTYRNMLLTALVLAITTCLIASRKLGMAPKSPAPIVQMGKPTPQPGPGGMEAPRNMWFEESMVANTFGASTNCSRDTAMPGAATSIMNNIIVIVFVYNGGSTSCHGYLVGGQYVLLNSHCLDLAYKLDATMSILFPFNGGGKMQGIPIDKSRIIRNKQDDLALMHVAALPPRTDKYDFFIEANHDWQLFEKYTFCLPSTEVEGHTEVKSIKTSCSWMEPGGRSIQANVSENTVFGDCGRILLGLGPHGACILGIHQALSRDTEKTIQIALVTRTWLLRARAALQAKCEPEHTAYFAQNAYSFSTVHFGDIQQSEDPILDKDDNPVKMKEMSENCALHPKHKTAEESEFSISGHGISWLGKIEKIGRKKIITNVQHTPFRSMFESFGYKCSKEAPIFDWKAKVLHARNVGKTSNNLDSEILEECVQTYIKQILETLPASEHALFEAYDLETALNGVPGVAYVDSVKVKTSAGNPYYKPKRELLYTDYDGNTVTYSLQPQFEKNLWKYYRMMVNGERPRLLFSANMKDEGISPEKNKTRGPRLFMAGNIYSILLGRMLFLSYIRVVQRNPFIFFSAPGMNCYSRIWHKLFLYITKFGLDTILAGDYKNFDQKMAPKILEAAYSVIIGVMTSKLNGVSKFSLDERMAAKVWASSCSFPDCEVDGDCYQICGTNPSGNTMTVHTNCTVNVIYIMYSWKWTGHKLELFFTMVVIMTYGDDNIIAVCVTVRMTFNYGTIYPALLTIGVEYTPADKSSPTSKQFDLLENLQFLKRGFKERNGRMLCPIDISTIHKLGMLWVKSTLSPELHGLAVLRDIWRESYMHGEEFQKENQGYVEQVLEKYYNTNSAIIGGFLSNEEYEKLFDQNSDRYEAFSNKKPESVNFVSEKPLSNHIVQSLILCEHSAEERGYYVEPPEAIPQTTNLVEVGVLQNGPAGRLWSGSSSIKLTANSNLTTFEDNSSAQVEKMDMVPSTIVPHISNPVSEWLTRPTKLFDIDWDELNTVNLDVSPFYEYLVIPRIWDKLKGFSRFRGDLHLKFVMNASPFHYGALLVSWAPMNGGASIYSVQSAYGGNMVDNIAADTVGEFMLASVRPHVMMFPQDSSSAEMILKFIYPKDWVNLKATAGASLELDLLGTLTFRSLTPLMVAQAATGNRCTISVFAWLENPQLAGPSFIPQSKVMDGVADATSELTEMPVLGQAFDTTSKLARATASVMKLLGYSNPINTATINAMTPTSAPHLSSTEISIPTSHLGVSERSGLTLEANGIQTDELVIADMCKRDALIGVYPWTNANSVGTELFKAFVTPEIFRQKALQYKISTANYYAVYQTPCCYPSQLFQYWRGTMVYTLRLVSSQFHSGRIRVFYDASQAVPITTPEAGVYSQVLDITSEKELELRVPWNADKPFLNLKGAAFRAGTSIAVAPITSPDNFSHPSSALYDSETHNGAISVQVLNTLMGPITSTVYLLITVRMEDAEFADPCTLGDQQHGRGSIDEPLPISPYPMYWAQSKFEATPGAISDCNSSEVIGEKVQSLRELLHRSNAYAAIVPDRKVGGTVTVTFTENQIGLPRIPLSPGQPCYTDNIGTPPTIMSNNGQRIAWGSVGVGTSTYPYNFLRMSPYMYLKGAFIGERGSHIYKVVAPTAPAATNVNPHTITLARAHRYVVDQTGFDITVANGNAGADILTIKKRPGTSAGLTMNTSAFDNSLSVSVPMYSRLAFLPTNPVNVSANTDLEIGADGSADMSIDNIIATLDYPSSNNGAGARTPLKTFHSVGVDFNFIGFVNPPVLFVGQTWPVAKI